MIIFFRNGQLGNQLFQYNSLITAFPTEKVFFINCHEIRYFRLANTLDRPHITLLPERVSIALRLILSFLARLRIIGLIEECLNSSHYRLVKKRGFLGFLFYGYDLFFQHKDVIEHLESKLALNSEHIEIANSWLRNQLLDPSSQVLVFVHIRMGDFLCWPSPDKPAMLPLNWYIARIETMRAMFSDAKFIICTDDIESARKSLRPYSYLYISDNSMIIDFAIMTLCKHGILSASSFSWWAAYYAKQANSRGGLFIAPKYWAGHASSKWFPSYFKTEWLKYCEVENYKGTPL